MKAKIIFIEDAPPFNAGDVLTTSAALAAGIVGRGTAKYADFEPIPAPDLAPASEPEPTPDLAPAPAPKAKK